MNKSIPHTPDGVILHITTSSEPELMAWVRSFGCDIEVVRNDMGS